SFLALLPGRRDGQGLPESIRFWKKRIEQDDPDTTFRVGLISGESGCGKSSLVKAGLLPSLAGRGRKVCVEATAEGTEAALLRALRKEFPDLPEGEDLADALASLWLGHGLVPEQKLLLVLDQFEQWLHANEAAEGAELVRALGRCDGRRV